MPPNTPSFRCRRRSRPAEPAVLEGRLFPFGEDELLQVLALPRLLFAFAQLLRQRVWIAEVANRRDGDRLEIIWNLEGSLRFVVVKAGHGMSMQSERRYLDGEVRHGRPGVVPGVAV